MALAKMRHRSIVGEIGAKLQSRKIGDFNVYLEVEDQKTSCLR